jgi:hypothetical protein
MRVHYSWTCSARAEDELAKTEDALGKQNSQVAELSKTVRLLS